MTNSLKYIGTFFAGVLVSLLFTAFYVNNAKFGGVYETNLSQFSNLKIGESGTELRLVKAGTCSLVSNSSIAATSTGTGTCSIPGALAGDQVFVSLATTTTNINSQFVIVGTVAATDSATVRLVNLTGTARTPASVSGFGSSTQYSIYR